MKHYAIVLVLMSLVLASCGQQESSSGETDTPPISVPPVTETAPSVEVPTDNTAEDAMEKTDDAMVEEEKVMEESTDSMEKTEDVMEKDSDESMMKDDEDTMEKDSNDAMEKEEVSVEVMQKEVMDDPIVLAGQYTDYNIDLVGQSDSTVIFFHAGWCPSCRAAHDGISSGELPAGVTVLRADYDNSADLKEKYGVVTQHTFVQVDADGELIKKWVGGNSVDSITEKIN